VPPARGTSGIPGRALTALALTLRDVGEDETTSFIGNARDPDLARGGGLRGGHYRIDRRNRLHLFGVVFVPGVRVSGLVRHFGAPGQSGRLRISGRAAPDGVLSLRGRRVSGRLGGRWVHAVLSARLPGTASALRSALRPAPSVR
jgi:hypothetical protein